MPLVSPLDTIVAVRCNHRLDSLCSADLIAALRVALHALDLATGAVPNEDLVADNSWLVLKHAAEEVDAFDHLEAR